MLGSALVAPTEKEVEMRKICRRSVVATSDISEGQVFGEENLGLRRPGDGLAPKYYSSIVGMKARRNIAKGEQVLMGDF
jgi:sialic acid synthase SpsE